MFTESTTDRGVMVGITVATEPGHRCTLIRASSELGVHRRGEVDDGGVEGADGEEDRPTPLQVRLSPKFIIIITTIIIIIIY